MADELFEALWGLRGGPEFVALHAIFGGSAVPSEEIRQVLGLTLEQFRSAVEASGKLGMVIDEGDRLRFQEFPSDSAQRARLDDCLESRQEEFRNTVRTMKSRTLLRFLGTPPQNQS